MTQNLPTWERIARSIAGIAAVIIAFVAFTTPLFRYGLAGSGVALAVTAWLGFCPACAMVGRRL